MKSVSRQNGMVLLLIVLTLLAIGGVAILTSYGSGTGSALRNQKKLTTNAEVMAEARTALIGYALNGTPGAGNRPGQMPPPDTLQNTNYDGTSDANSCLNGAAMHGLPALSAGGAKTATLQCVGRLPWKALGLAIDGASETDLFGIVPWYAVSQNLAEPNPDGPCMLVLNPVTAAANTTAFACDVSTGPAWPWLKVCDATGKLLSDRVAFVLIMPGEMLPTTGRTQARKNVATGLNPEGHGNPGDFLDAIPTPAGWAALPANQRCSVYDNAALTGEYVVAPTSATFNDQLIYVTIDELMPELERRAANEVREALTAFRATYSSYPWAAPLGNPAAPLTALVSTTGTTAGLIPFHTNTSSTTQKFMTELSWNIVSDVLLDTRTPAGNNTTASTQFQCGGGPSAVCMCRPRIASGALFVAVPRTVTDAQFTSIKNGSTTSVSAPQMTCSRDSSTSLATRNTRLSCDVFSYTVASAVTYPIQRRSGNCTTDPYTAGVSIGNYTGIQTRTIKLTLAGVIGTGTATLSAGDSGSHARRSFTTASMPTIDFIEVTDRWQPDTLGAIPFDQFSTTFPSGMQTGFANTQATGTTTLSNIRVYPDLPNWYFTQKWHESLYAAFSPDVTPATNAANCTTNCFTVGAKTNVNAVVISAGPQLAGQNRFAVTPAASDFLEAPNATGSTTRIFASTTLPRSTTYADTVVTIPK